MTRKFLMLAILSISFQIGCTYNLATPNKESIVRSQKKETSIYDYPSNFYAAYEKEPSDELPPSLKGYFEQEPSK
jgi:hypothetical protein